MSQQHPIRWNGSTAGRAGQPKRLCDIAIVTLATLLCSGCNGPEQADRLPTFPVEGQALADGQPAEGALIVFHPLDASAPISLRPSGRVGADGTFRLTSYETGDGAPAGKYAVTVLWPEPPTHPLAEPDMGRDRLAGRYLTPERSPLRAEVGEGENRLQPFEL